MVAPATVFPIPQAPLVDASGRVTTAWFRFFISLVQRTGGTGGRITPEPAEPFQVGLFDFAPQGEMEVGQLVLDLGQRTVPPAAPWWPETPPKLQPLLSLFLPAIGSPAAPDAVTVGASPYSYSPGFDGFAVVSGGTVSNISVSRDGGATTFTTGEITGIFPLTLSDTLILTYTVVPTLTFFRR